jgi:hypothetical protein
MYFVEILFLFTIVYDVCSDLLQIKQKQCMNSSKGGYV